jgi:predicted RNA-binding protein with PUA-like domain
MYARQFLNTDMAPGEQQVFTFEVGEEVSVPGVTNFCAVDVSDDLEEGNEENNENEENPEELLQLRPRKTEGKDVRLLGEDIREED